MVIRVYVSGISGNKEVKKRQQRVLMILESKNIPCEIIDITEPGKESDKEFMQQHSKPRGDQKHPLPPQIFNDEEYCGDFVGYDLANENDKLLPFLKMAVPEPSPPPEPKEEPKNDNEGLEAEESESESEEELKPSRPRPRPPPKALSTDDKNDVGTGIDEDQNKNQGMEGTSPDDEQQKLDDHEEQLTREDVANESVEPVDTTTEPLFSEEHEEVDDDKDSETNQDEVMDASEE